VSIKSEPVAEEEKTKHARTFRFTGRQEVSNDLLDGLDGSLANHRPGG
jgi:hypothetical protein